MCFAMIFGLLDCISRIMYLLFSDYCASRETMDNLRRFIEAQPNDLQRWHQRKNVYLVCNREVDGQLFSADLCDELAKGFQQLQPLYELFWRVM